MRGLHMACRVGYVVTVYSTVQVSPARIMSRRVRSFLWRHVPRPPRKETLSSYVGGFDVADHAEGEGGVTGRPSWQAAGWRKSDLRGPYKHIVDGVAVLADCHGFEEWKSSRTRPFVLVFCSIISSFRHGEAGSCGRRVLSRSVDGVVDSVVEDHAVLEDFDYGSAFMAGGSGEDVLRCVSLTSMLRAK